MVPEHRWAWRRTTVSGILSLSWSSTWRACSRHACLTLWICSFHTPVFQGTDSGLERQELNRLDASFPCRRLKRSAWMSVSQTPPRPSLSTMAGGWSDSTVGRALALHTADQVPPRHPIWSPARPRSGSPKPRKGLRHLMTVYSTLEHRQEQSLSSFEYGPQVPQK